MKNIVFSIVVYKEDSKQIANLLRFLQDYITIVVDNSPSNNLQNLLQQYTNVIYLHFPQNIGFGSGHNKAFEVVKDKADIFVVINPDIFFNVKEMDFFLKWFIKSDYVLAIPKVLNLDGSIQDVVREVPTPLTLLKRRLSIYDDIIQVSSNTIQEIPFAHGCFMAFKASVFRQLQGFDERFFLYMEDVDIWIRAKKYGKTVINTNYTIIHKHRKGSRKNIKLFIHHLISAYKFFLKY